MLPSSVEKRISPDAEKRVTVVEVAGIEHHVVDRTGQLPDPIGRCLVLQVIGPENERERAVRDDLSLLDRALLRVRTCSHAHPERTRHSDDEQRDERDVNPSSQAVPSQHVREPAPCPVSRARYRHAFASGFSADRGIPLGHSEGRRDLGRRAYGPSRSAGQLGQASIVVLLVTRHVRAGPRQCGLPHRARAAVRVALPIDRFGEHESGRTGRPGVDPTVADLASVRLLQRARSMTSHRPHAPEPPTPSKTRASSEPSPSGRPSMIWISWIPSLGDRVARRDRRASVAMTRDGARRRSLGRGGRSRSPAPPRRSAPSRRRR